MSKKDLYNNLDIDVTIAAQFVNSNTTLTGTGVDLRGFEGACVIFQAGTIAGSSSANIHTFELQESDSSGTGFTAVADADLIGTEAAVALNGGTDSVVKKLGYIGTKRYIRVVDTTTAFTTAGGSIAVSVIKGAPHLATVGA